MKKDVCNNLNMRRKILLLTATTCSLVISGIRALSVNCTDLQGRIITPGLHYVPGPDSCTLCVCENGNPKWCKAVLCSPPQHCKSFRVGQSCCDFICLDDTLHNSDGATDLGLRLIASAVTAILLLSLLFFLIHRLRQRKTRGRQNRQLSEDERSLGSIGYIAGSLAYLPGSMGYLGASSQERHLEFRYEDPPAHYPLWKPPGNYFPRGEAPPPYEEAVAAARAEAALAAASIPPSHQGHHRTIPINLATSGAFRLDSSSSAGATVSTVNETQAVSQRTRAEDNTQNAAPSNSDPPLTSLVALSLTASSTSSNTVVTVSPNNKSGALVPSPVTIAATALPSLPSSSFQSEIVYNEVLPSSSNPLYENTTSKECPAGSLTSSITTSHENHEYTDSPAAGTSSSAKTGLDSISSGTSVVEIVGSYSLLDGLDPCSCNVTITSYPCLSRPPSQEDNDDYRSECENCKSTHGSRYYLEDSEENLGSQQETMTLHRRLDHDTEDQLPVYYRTSLTLPTNCRRQRSLPLNGSTGSSLHGARENWFSSMPESSTSSSDEDE